MKLNEKVSLAIIGGGPAGIEAGLQASKKGISYSILEKDTVGSLIGKTMAQKKFHQTYGKNTSAIKGDLAFPDRATGGELVKLWEEQTRSLNFFSGTQFVHLKKNDGNIFSIETNSGTMETDYILLATGTFESPRKIKVPCGTNDSRIKYRIDYSENYQNKEIIIVGGGNSAAETAIYFGGDNNVTMVIRKKEFTESITPDNQENLLKLANSNKITLLFESELKELKEKTAKIKTGEVFKDIPCDLLFIHIGFEKPIEFLQSLGILIDESQGVAKPLFNEHFETNLPNLFIAGSLTGADSIIESANQAYDIVNYIVSKKDD